MRTWVLIVFNASIEVSSGVRRSWSGVDLPEQGFQFAYDEVGNSRRRSGIRTARQPGRRTTSSSTPRGRCPPTPMSWPSRDHTHGERVSELPSGRVRAARLIQPPESHPKTRPFPRHNILSAR